MAYVKWFCTILMCILAYIALVSLFKGDTFGFWIVLLVMAPFAFLRFLCKHMIQNRLKAKNESRMRRIRSQYREWRAVAESDGLKPIHVPIRLQKDEVAYAFYRHVQLLEVRVLGKVGTSKGTALHLFGDGGGVSFGDETTETEYVRGADVIGVGDLCVTNRHVIFSSDACTRIITLNSILRDNGKEDFYDVWTNERGRSQFIGVNGWICDDLVECLSQI